jgi:hypothetical protein
MAVLVIVTVRPIQARMSEGSPQRLNELKGVPEHWQINAAC